MAIHSSILAWRIPWTEEPGLGVGWGLWSMGLQRVRHDQATEPACTVINARLAPLSVTFARVPLKEMYGLLVLRKFAPRNSSSF